MQIYHPQGGMIKDGLFAYTTQCGLYHHLSGTTFCYNYQIKSQWMFHGTSAHNTRMLQFPNLRGTIKICGTKISFFAFFWLTLHNRK